MVRITFSCQCVFNLILSFIIMTSLVTSQCTFPDFVTQRSMWIATYINEASLKSKITGDTIESSFCTHNGLVCAEFVRKCNETRDHDKFIVEHTDKTQLLAQTEYLCIQFLKRSNDVIQIKTSTKMSVKSPSMCDNLNLDHWPLTSPSLRTAPSITCPFTGGFNMEMLKSNGKPLCANKIPRARMESECGYGTGIVFDFKHGDCLHDNLKMDLIQNVDCMAVWSSGNQQFVILRPDSDNFQPYCLRITTRSYDSMHAYLFMDFVCDPGNSHGNPTRTGNYLSINLTKYVINSLCEDEFQECAENKFCKTDMEAHCKKSCYHCRPEASICAIPEYIRGSWGVLETNITSMVDISTYEFSQKNLGNFQCLKSNYTDKNQMILLQTFENGCYPKFSCLEVFQTSPSIIQFRLGKRTSWPVFPLEDVGKLTCNEKQFSTSIISGQNKETVQIQKTTAVDPKYYYGVDCGLSDEFSDGVYSLYFQEGAKCDGCIDFDARYDHTVFTISTIECSNADKELNYLCLASYKLSTNSTTAVITKRKSKIDEFLCWVFTGSGANRKLLVLKVSNCNELSVRLVLEGNLKPKASFDIVENPPKDCPKRTNSKKLRNVAENTVIYKANGNSVVTVNISGSATSHMRNIFAISALLIVVVYEFVF